MFPDVKKNFGFGCMRLKKVNGEVDMDLFCKMIDKFMENGFNYFDTAHGYVDGKSEICVREGLVKRYPRDSFILTDKLSQWYFKKEEDIRPLFEKQLEACGVDYFDFYLMHTQTRENYKQFTECRAYEIASELKKEGKIRHMGISFHDTADILEMILKDHPEVEVVQLQINYYDYDSDVIQSRKCYEVAEKYGKPVIVMEPVKGGSLVNLSGDALKVVKEIGDGSPASLAIRFAASHKNVFMVLSGMNSMEQMDDNLSYMKDFKPLSDKEQKGIEKLCKVIKSVDLIQCTDCEYCVDGCPKKIYIPEIFSAVNRARHFDKKFEMYRYKVATDGHGKASECIKCGKCEKVCPQHLPIRKLLEEAVETFEK